MSNYSQTQWQDRDKALGRFIKYSSVLSLGYVGARANVVLSHHTVIDYALIGFLLILMLIIDTWVSWMAWSEKSQLDRKRRAKWEEERQFNDERRQLEDQIERLWDIGDTELVGVEIVPWPDGHAYIRAEVHRFPDTDREPRDPIGRLTVLFEIGSDYARSLDCHFVDGSVWEWSSDANPLPNPQEAVTARLVRWVQGEILKQRWPELTEITQAHWTEHYRSLGSI